jgi:hypothetical protein
MNTNPVTLEQLHHMVDEFADMPNTDTLKARVELLKVVITSLFTGSVLDDLGRHPLWEVNLNTGKSVHEIRGHIHTDLGLPAWVLLNWASAPNPTKLPYVVSMVRTGINKRFPGLFDNTVASLYRHSVAEAQQLG